MKKARISYGFLDQRRCLATGVVVRETYWQGKRKHCSPADGPAVIHRDWKTGTVTYEEFNSDGLIDRIGGPAIIERDPKSGIITRESYYELGQKHRSDGPAVILRDRVTDITFHVAYWQNDRKHREPSDGPASIDRDRVTGALVSETYWVHGTKIPAPERPSQRPPQHGTTPKLAPE